MGQIGKQKLGIAGVFDSIAFSQFVSNPATLGTIAE
jgi:hypothetical protein